MKLFRISAVFILVTAIAASILPAGAQGMPPGPPPNGGQGMPPGPPPPDPILGPAGRLLHEIGLTRAQDKQLRDVVGKAIDAGLGQAARGFMEARHALEVLVWNAASSDQDMISAEQTLSDRTRDLEQARKHLAADILAVLTEDQRAEFLERLGEDPKPPMGPPPSRR